MRHGRTKMTESCVFCLYVCFIFHPVHREITSYNLTVAYSNLKIPEQFPSKRLPALIFITSKSPGNAVAVIHFQAPILQKEREREI